MEVASPMRPAGRLPEAGCSIRSKVIKLPVAFVAISLKDAAGTVRNSVREAGFVIG